MPTIYELAKKAGVSPGTVSKVFNNYSRINDKTREKVFRIAKEMNYVPNLNAQSLKTKQTFLVGIIFSENVGIGLDHQFFSSIIEKFRHRIGEFGYDTIFINNTLGNDEIGYLEHCKYRNVDGVFIITALPDEINMVKLLESKIKCVTTDMIVEHRPYVMSNNENGAEKAVEYLYQCGHRKIGHIAGPLDTISAGERCKGYLSGLERFGLKFETDLIIESKWFKYEEAYEATFEYINRFSDGELPTALFVSSDIMAIAVIKALKFSGLRVPEDISVIGFDDIEYARLSIPELTTIRQNTVEIGEKVADTLYKLIVNEEVEAEVTRIPVELVIRESVKIIKEKED